MKLKDQKGRERMAVLQTDMRGAVCEKMSETNRSPEDGRWCPCSGLKEAKSLDMTALLTQSRKSAIELLSWSWDRWSSACD